MESRFVHLFTLNVFRVQDTTTMDSRPSIPEVFKGKVVLITGATGFLGKVLLEKLLRSCPDIREILVLLRPMEKGSDQRLGDLLKNGVFNNLRIKNPDALLKVSYLTGDIIDEDLGLDKPSFKRVVDNVSFVFHCAASVRFDDEPRKTFDINLVGVCNVLEVCHLMKKLEAFVHVSTAYSFCNQVIISEQIYKENVGPYHILHSLKWMNKDQLQSVCDSVVPGRPSLYHYSKAVAEIYLAENHEGLPVIIVRPAIITASYRDPFPGWIDNYNGPSGFIALSTKGIIKTLLVNEKVVANWVPVDMVANTLIVAAHLIATERKAEGKSLVPCSTTEIPIINCVCPENNSITWSEIIKTCMPLVHKYPSQRFYRTPGKGVVTSSRVLHTICKCVSHYLPAAIIDIVLLIFYRNMNLIRSYRRIHGVMDRLQHYTTHSFIFTSSNMHTLTRQMSQQDSDTFPIDQKLLNWNEYLENYVHGVRRFYLRESDNNLDAARTKLLMYERFCLCFKITTAGILLILLNRRFLKLNPSSFFGYCKVIWSDFMKKQIV